MPESCDASLSTFVFTTTFFGGSGCARYSAFTLPVSYDSQTKEKFPPAGSAFPCESAGISYSQQPETEKQMPEGCYGAGLLSEASEKNGAATVSVAPETAEGVQ